MGNRAIDFYRQGKRNVVEQNSTAFSFPTPPESNGQPYHHTRKLYTICKWDQSTGRMFCPCFTKFGTHVLIVNL